ncbi:hypothetical protein ACQUW5_13195 [Legionella sp. CNM-1927-20]|uniref:hypothetical protein n=1 Tax=Legionella sp. CNM-1927-20 TaxID=3422221 RepID=UPI00403B21AE
MFKLDLSKLSDYVASQENANRTKFNLSNNLLEFLQEKDWVIKILKACLIKAYLENSFIEEKAEQLSRYWSLGKLWSLSVDEDIPFNIEIISVFLNSSNYKRFLAEGIPLSLPKKSWYQSQKLHTVIYDLYQQILEYEKRLQVENDIVVSFLGL